MITHHKIIGTKAIGQRNAKLDKWGISAYRTEMVERIDAIGLLCPLPVLKIAKRLRQLEPGTILEILADDPAARIDIPHFCNEAGHELVSSESTPSSGENTYLYRVRRGP